MAHFFDGVDDVRLLDRRYFFADDGELPGHFGIGQRFFKLLKQFSALCLGGGVLGQRLGQAEEER